MFMTVYSDICFEERVKLLKGALKYVLAFISATETDKRHDQIDKSTNIQTNGHIKMVYKFVLFKRGPFKPYRVYGFRIFSVHMRTYIDRCWGR